MLRPTTQKTAFGLFSRPTIAHNRLFVKAGARPQHPTQQTSVFAALRVNHLLSGIDRAFRGLYQILKPVLLSALRPRLAGAALRFVRLRVLFCDLDMPLAVVPEQCLRAGVHQSVRAQTRRRHP